MLEFQLAKNRDAWFVIRGYRYQVDVTILRWLDLTDAQNLVLEFGEDIDIVNTAINAETPNRELEQVKHLDTNITLRSSASKCALANAVQHFETNPELDLIFRFCTNSEPSVERPSIFEKSESGILAWERLRTSDLPEPAAEQLVQLKALQIHLQSLAQPKTGVDADTWGAFVDFSHSATPQEIFSFIRRFEWSTKQPGAESLSDSLVSTIAEKQTVPEQEAIHIYARLFLHVVQALSHDGLKVLRRKDLDAVIALPRLSAAEEKKLQFLVSVILQHSNRIAELESTAERHESAISLLREHLIDVCGGAGLSLNLSNAISEISTALPPRVGHSCGRDATVSDLTEKIRRHDWTAVHGSVGAGKTQLATLIGDALQSVIYVSLRDLSSPEANFLLHHLFLQLSGGQQTAGASVTNSGLSAIANETVIFLDDVPRMEPEDHLAKRLCAIGRAVSGSGQALVTLSHFEVPQTVQERLSPSRFLSLRVPPLTANDVRELYVLHGAEENSLPEADLEVVAVATDGNPTLVAAIARSLSAVGWNQVQSLGSDISERKASGEDIHNTVYRLLKTVESQEARDLLYRLCVVMAQFGTNEIACVASVSPPLARSRELSSQLYGLWVERLADERFTVCPLVAQFGADELAPDVRKAVAKVLADLLFAQESLSPIDFAKGVSYLRRAEEWNQLGLRVLFGLQGVEKLPLAWQKIILRTTDVPELSTQCPAVLQLLIKARQIVLASQVGSVSSTLVSDALALSKSAQVDDELGVFIFAMQAGPTVAKYDLSGGLTLCEMALETVDTIADTPVGSELPWADFKRSYPWFFVGHLRSTDDLMRWFHVITKKREYAENAFQSDLARQGFRIALNQLWMLQHELPPEERVFTRVVKAYESIRQSCVDHNLPLFEALTVSSHIVVAAEYQNDLSTAVSLADSILSRGEIDAEVTFLITEVLGRQYLYAKQIGKAIELLTRACGVDVETFPNTQCRARLELSRAIGDADAQRSLSFAEDAVRIAKRFGAKVSALEMVSALGEAAVAAWFVDDERLAFDYLDEAISIQFRERQDSVDWKTRMALLSSYLAYMSSMVMFGSPPSEDFLVPPRGELLAYNKKVAGWFDDVTSHQLTNISVLLTNFAAGVDRIERTLYWANAGIKDVRKKGLLSIVSMLSEAIVPALIDEHRLDEAFDYADESSSMFVAGHLGFTSGQGFVTVRDADESEILGEKPNIHWDNAEERLAFIYFIPTIFSICSHGHGDDDRLLTLREQCDGRIESASNPRLFESMSTALTRFSEEEKAIELHKLGNVSQSSGEHLLYYLLSSFAADAKMEMTAATHAIVMHGLSRQTALASVLWSHLTTSLINYWERRFANAKFKFRNPRAVEDQFGKLRELPLRDRAQSLLRLILNGLAVQLPKKIPAVEEWVNDGR